MYTLFILVVFAAMVVALMKAIWETVSNELDDIERRTFGETLREKEGVSAVAGNV